MKSNKGVKPVPDVKDKKDKKEGKKEEGTEKIKIHNPWTQQPVKIDSSFGLLNSIIQKHYGEQPKYKSTTHTESKQTLSTALQLITDIKQISEHDHTQQKSLLYDKYRSQFDIIDKLVLMNNIISFINSSKEIQKVTPESHYSSCYVKVPCESQATFLKLYYRITKPEKLEFVTTLGEQQVQQLQSLKAQIISKLYLY